MKTVHTRAELAAALSPWRREDRAVALVPTMGHLHRGHLALVERARRDAQHVVASIFVNPLQFDRADDLAAYPRTLEADAQALADAGVDLLFAPPEAEVYPRGREGVTRVEVPGLGDDLEGAHRPGHFTGVATVVCKLFGMVRPHLAVFGEKDFQQLMIVRRMTADLDLGVEILSEPTVREPDGLALSSRNSLLDENDRARAPALYRSLAGCGKRLAAGETDVPALEQAGRAELEAAGLRPDYISIRRRQDLGPPGPEDQALVVLGAAWCGPVRLIDNLTVDLLHCGRLRIMTG
ncbi:pantoate--beta-alanine ligase [Thioalkalivibrio denitrificans]|uniref:Pantothenate synthetase n=1 Tax=Thioalkalivibrio denitrificans TaxID=108003 RepID=A0A1V3NFA0_9GAMM|nr:pantoate--beta-alanine ligase [Thioalkalivibrio denitrificans]OOG23777.1 pantoate--beta-alanine ligase [Thioalkalivibrio denitrificans]